MPVSKKFLDLVSKDSAVKKELDSATYKALFEFLKARGLEDEAAKAVDTATAAVAEAHGFKPEAMEEVSEDELKAVAGGIWCDCEITGCGHDGKHTYCSCPIGGEGADGSGGKCYCDWTGSGS